MNNVNNQILNTNYVSGTILGTGIETLLLLKKMEHITGKV